jgi:putative endonuclease
MKAGHRQDLGHRGESLAAKFLENKGYTVKKRNYRTPYGEIDLVVQREDVVVFVEVKARASQSLGPPEISITPRKAEHMHSAAAYYIQQHPELNNDWRIDVIAIQIRPDDPAPLIDHFENALS